MRRFLAAILTGLIALAPVEASAWRQGSPVTRTQKNLVTDYGATCNGIADDTSAFLAFKAAFQNNTPVTLTLPNGGNCTFGPVSGAGMFPFQGIGNLIVSGYGATLTNSIPSQNILFGGQGEFADGKHSARTVTANPGDSCVTLVNYPQINVTGIANAAGTSTITASIDATGLMTVTAVGTGTLAVNQFVFGAGTTVGTDQTPPGSYIKSLGTGAGGTGTYQLNSAVALGSQTLTTNGALRLTVSSTAGYANGNTVPIAGIVGNSNLTNAALGLQLIKVVDGTHIDLWQSTFPTGATYTSGGTVGGDQTGLYTVGNPVLMTGWDNQGIWNTPFGFPSNQRWFEHKTVTSKNSSTHQVCFDTALANTYLSTWPQYNTGNAFQVDAGGPATLYALDPSWETTQEYQGFNYVNPNFQTTAVGRNIKFTDFTWNGTNCGGPSQDQTYTWQNVSASTCNIEVDKMITTLNVTGGSTGFWKFQSSSTGTANFTNTTLVKEMNGTPVVFNGNNVTFQDTGGSNGGFQPGVAAYGSSNEVNCTNCTITNHVAVGGIQQTVDASWTFGATGIITIPLWQNYGSDAPRTRVFTPGTNFFLGNASFQTGALGQVTGVTQDLDNVYVQTSFTTGFPFTPTNIRTHPAPKFNCPGCTGSTDALSLAQCPANAPLFSCQVITYTGGAAGTTTVPSPLVWGNLTSITFTTPVLYAGAGALSFNLNQFSNWPMRKTSDNTTVSFGTAFGGGPNIDMKTNGTRVLSQSSVTGAVGTDVLHAAGTQLWVGGQGNNANFSANTAGTPPQVIVNMQTNQGVVGP